MALAFHKYEGLGNDFVLVEADREDAVTPEHARKLCDRRFGIGGDGVILVLPPRVGVARMRVLNADGSIPEMCGNGLRCAALHVARRRKQESGELTFDTDAGAKPCVIDDRSGLGVVTVDMGVVVVGDDAEIELDGEAWAVTLADAGNPHAIITRAATRPVIEVVGPLLATHSRFVAGTNVEFARFGTNEVDLVVWERGVGVTLACGTGACATVAVGVAKGWLEGGAAVRVRLPGGDLAITILEDGRALMRGPARHVFSGEMSP